MDGLEGFAPWIVVGLGLLGMFAPSLASKLKTILALFAKPKEPSTGESASEKQSFVASVVRAMEMCEQAQCPGGVEAAKQLLQYIDQIKPMPQAK